MIKIGHALPILQALPDNTVHCIVTSPPYFQLRDYNTEPVTWPDGWIGSLGKEPTPEMYVAHLVMVFQECKRVLRNDGCFWLNISDSYAGSNQGRGTKHMSPKQASNTGTQYMCGQAIRRLPPGLKPQELCGIPERLVLALQKEGWYWRSTTIWEKVNPMPEPINGWRWEQHRIKVRDVPVEETIWKKNKLAGVNMATGQHHEVEWKDCPGCPKCSPNNGLILRKGSWRPVRSFEYLYLLTKTLNYFGDAEAVKEPIAESTKTRDKYSRKGGYSVQRDHETSSPDGKRNRRNVWTIATHPYKGAHFATMPEALIRPMILSSTSEKVCPKCGTCWSPIVKRTRLSRPELPPDDPRYRPNTYEGSYSDINGRGDAGYTFSEVLGYKPSCDCDGNDGSGKAIVLDPFAGACTTGLVAVKLGRAFLGIEQNPEYAKMGEERIANGVL